MAGVTKAEAGEPLTVEIRAWSCVTQQSVKTRTTCFAQSPSYLQHRKKVGVLHGLQRSQPLLVVVAKQLIQEVQRLRTDEVLVLAVHEPFPPLSRVPPCTQKSNR